MSFGNEAVIWEKVDLLYPKASVQWDIQGGPEWIDNRSGPRIYCNPASLYIYVGGQGSYYDWECITWDVNNEIWRLDILNGYKPMSGKSRKDSSRLLNYEAF